MKKTVIGLLAVVFVLAILASVFAEENKESFHAYTVKRGDTLSEIAYGLGVSMEELIKWNPELGIRLVYPGQRIKYLAWADIFETVENDGSLTRAKIKAQGEETIGAIKDIQRGLPKRQMGTITFVLVAVSLIVLCALIYFGLLRKPKQRDVMPKSLELKISGRKFRYFPLVQDGKYVSLYKPNGITPLLFSELGDLAKSLKSSLKNDELLIRQEIRNKRLVDVG